MRLAALGVLLVSSSCATKYWENVSKPPHAYLSVSIAKEDGSHTVHQAIIDVSRLSGDPNKFFQFECRLESSPVDVTVSPSVLEETNASGDSQFLYLNKGYAVLLGFSKGKTSSEVSDEGLVDFRFGDLGQSRVVTDVSFAVLGDRYIVKVASGSKTSLVKNTGISIPCTLREKVLVR